MKALCHCANLSWIPNSAGWFWRALGNFGRGGLIANIPLLSSLKIIPMP